MVDLVMSQIITPLPHQCTDTVTMIVVVLFVASLELVVSVNKFVMSRYVMSCVVCGAHPWKSDSAPLNVASLLLSLLFMDHSLSLAHPWNLSYVTCCRLVFVPSEFVIEAKVPRPSDVARKLVLVVVASVRTGW